MATKRKVTTPPPMSGKTVPPPPRARASSSDKPKAPRSSRKAPKPPNSVKPGWVHETLAKVTLRAAQHAARTKGVNLQVGNVSPELPDAINPGDGGPSDTQPADLLARVFAHAGHRVPGVKRIEKKLEGKETTSGPLSDLGAFVVQIYARNEDAIQDFVAGVIAAAQTQTGTPAGPPPSPNGDGMPIAGIHHPAQPQTGREGN